MSSALLPGLLLAQCAGLLLGDRALLPSSTYRALAVAALVASLVVPHRLRFALALGVVAAASSAALGQRLEGAVHGRPQAPIARTVEGRIAARDVRPGWTRLDLAEVVPADGEGPLPAGVRLQARDDGRLARFATGDRVRARIVLEAPAPVHNPGERERVRSLARQGIGALARPVDPALVVRRFVPPLPVPPVTVWLEPLRERAGTRLARLGRGGALLRAFACGERGSLPATTRQAFQELGLSHLLSVSGLHLVLVAGLAYTLLVRALRSVPRLAAAHDLRRAALGLALPAAAFYAVFSGFEVPVQRSLVVVVAAVLALAQRRPLRARSALLAAAFLVLAAEPAALFDAGAQMSFAASAALLALRHEGDDAPASPAARQRFARGLRELLSTSAAATAATVPIAATHLGVIAPAGMVANLLFVPWTGAVLLPASLLAAAVASLPADNPPGALLLRLCAALGEGTCRAAEALAAWLPDLPPSGVPGPGTLLLCAVLALAATRGRRLRLRLAAAALSCVLLARVTPPALAPASPRVVFLDVGQGDATLVQGVDGAIAVDGGLALPGGMDLGRTTVLPALAALGITHLDLLVVTHGDSDHRGGVPAILQGVPVERVWVPPGAREAPAFAAVVAAARARGVPVDEVGAGDPPLVAGDLTALPLWPPRGAALASGNDGSLVVRVAVAQGRSVLLPGDLEAAAEEALVAGGAALRSDVLKLAHHGSRTSSTPALLAAVDPALAVVSAPCIGRFGMPHPEVVARLARMHIPWRWTGRDGAQLVGLGAEEDVRSFAETPLACTPGRRREAQPRPARSQRPVKRGGRFSAKARWASRASSVPRSGRPSSSCRR